VGERDLARYLRLGVARDWWTRVQRRLFHRAPSSPGPSSPVASCCSRPTLPCSRPGPSCVTTTKRYPSETSTQPLTPGYSRPLQLLALALAGCRRPETHDRASTRVLFGSRTSTCRRSREGLWISLCDGAPWRPGTSLPLLLPARRRWRRLHRSRDWAECCSRGSLGPTFDRVG